MVESLSFTFFCSQVIQLFRRYYREKKNKCFSDTFSIFVHELILSKYAWNRLHKKHQRELTYVGSQSVHNLWWAWQCSFYTNISGHHPEGVLPLRSVNFFGEDITLPDRHNWCHLILNNAKTNIYLNPTWKLQNPFKYFKSINHRKIVYF